MNAEFMDAIYQIIQERGIEKDTLISALEAALTSAYRKSFGGSQNIVVKFDQQTGHIQVLAKKVIVESVKDENREIPWEEARKNFPEGKIGDIIHQEISTEEWGRVAAQTAKQVIVQRIREAEREQIYDEYKDRVGDVLNTVVIRQDQRNVIVTIGKTEAILPYKEQIPGETYRMGDRLKVYVLEVKLTSKGPQIVVSRTHPGLLKNLLKLEVPEISEGVVEIKAVAREPGERAKVAVHSWDKKVDPLGACVGVRGSRVQTITRELKGEKIDVVTWSEDPAIYVANALSPARVLTITVNELERSTLVIVPNDHLSLAIGRKGQNVRLAARLTNWKIDIKSDIQLEKEEKERALATAGEES